MTTKKKSRVDLLKEMFKEYGLDTEFFSQYATYVGTQLDEVDRDLWQICQSYSLDVESDFERAKSDPKIQALGAAMAATTKEFLGIGAPRSPEEAFAARNVGVPNTTLRQAETAVILGATEVTPMSATKSTKKPQGAGSNQEEVIDPARERAITLSNCLEFLQSGAAEDLLVDARIRVSEHRHAQSKYRHDLSVNNTVLMPVAILRLLAHFDRSSEGWAQLWPALKRWRVATIFRDAHRKDLPENIRVPAQLAVDVLTVICPLANERKISDQLIKEKKSTAYHTSAIDPSQRSNMLDTEPLFVQYGEFPQVFMQKGGTVTCDVSKPNIIVDVRAETTSLVGHLLPSEGFTAPSDATMTVVNFPYENTDKLVCVLTHGDLYLVKRKYIPESKYLDVGPLFKDWGNLCMAFALPDGTVTCDFDKGGKALGRVWSPNMSVPAGEQVVEVQYEDTGKLIRICMRGMAMALKMPEKPQYIRPGVYSASVVDGKYPLLNSETGRFSSEKTNEANKPRGAGDYKLTTNRYVRPQLNTNKRYVASKASKPHSSETGRVASDKPNMKEVGSKNGYHRKTISANYKDTELRVILPFLFTTEFERMAEDSLYGSAEARWLTEDLGIPYTKLNNCVDASQVRELVCERLRRLPCTHTLFQIPGYLRPILHLLHAGGATFEKDAHWTHVHQREEFSLTINDAPLEFHRIGFCRDGRTLRLQIPRHTNSVDFRPDQNVQDLKRFTLRLRCLSAWHEIIFADCFVKQYEEAGEIIHIWYTGGRRSYGCLPNPHGETMDMLGISGPYPPLIDNTKLLAPVEDYLISWTKGKRRRQVAVTCMDQLTVEVNGVPIQPDCIEFEAFPETTPHPRVHLLMSGKDWDAHKDSYIPSFINEEFPIKITLKDKGVVLRSDRCVGKMKNASQDKKFRLRVTMLNLEAVGREPKED